MSITTIEPSKSKLCKIVEEGLPDIDITPVGRKYFNALSRRLLANVTVQDNIGLNYIKQYGLEEDIANLMLGLSSKYYCLAATGALLKYEYPHPAPTKASREPNHSRGRYVESLQNIVFTNHSIRFKYQVIEGTMMIDTVTARNLELVTNIMNPKSTHSLFGVLNYTYTPMGARLLRMNILQPLCDAVTLNTRLDAVEELTETEDVFFNVRSALKSFLDVDHLITALIQVPKKPSVKHAEQSINNVITLKHTLKLIPPLRLALSGVRSDLLLAIRKILSDSRLELLESRIDEIINEDVTFQKSAMGLRNQRCYAVKAGFNGLLDVARQTYKETTNDVYELVNGYSQKYDIPIKVSFNPVVGFYLTTTQDQLGDRELPLEFINVVRKKKLFTFTTLKLISHNDRIQESLTEVYLMSDKTIAELIAEIRSHVGILYKASESIGILDMIAGFAHKCTVSNCVRPEFTDTLAIKSGRHPIRESIHMDTFVPNDTYVSEATNVQIVTGPNMSGKSTYLRQIALITIVAQIGAFVPAEYASVRLVDGLFSRIGNDDCVEANASTFMLEMRETAFILQNMSDTSLIIIDELGRGTSTSDGLGITYAVCEEFVRRKAFVFLATHFQELTVVLDAYPNVVNLHLEIAMPDPARPETSITYLYTVRDGASTETHYGLKLAELAGLPPSIMERGGQISRKLKRRIERSRARSRSSRDAAMQHAQLQVTQRLIQARRSSTLSEPELRKYLASLQKEYLEEIAAIEAAYQGQPVAKPIQQEQEEENLENGPEMEDGEEVLVPSKKKGKRKDISKSAPASGTEEDRQ
ncbi:MutS protein msh4 [Borealophlyctis nickersoniae]|nr:MutS protein msh4 [Borealophlyctis nickersoniae]